MWRHVAPPVLGEPDVFGGVPVRPAATMTADSVTWTAPASAYPGLTAPSDACVLDAQTQVQNVVVDTA